MSALESEVIPFISSLANDTRQLTSLSTTEGSSLALWAVKTAIVLSNSVGSPLFKTLPEHAAALFRSRAKRLPNGVAVFGHTSSTHRALWSLCPTWVVETLSGAQPESFLGDYEAAYKVFLQIGNLMLLVCWWPAEDFSFKKEPWISPALATSVIVEQNEFDSRTVFSDESEAFMIGVGVSLP